MRYLYIDYILFKKMGWMLQKNNIYRNIWIEVYDEVENGVTGTIILYWAMYSFGW